MTTLLLATVIYLARIVFRLTALGMAAGWTVFGVLALADGHPALAVLAAAGAGFGLHVLRDLLSRPL
ncbi:hypothetical protein [Actinomadura rupiterrae]|uniref:hypothetical protein n=1 Tax=Actinomadura rupiterrae TaxID=559627 RepID=UPI0020A5F355|nr:hypothetical protein [Actinomadura rupiterrae]MCP2337896.1 hypothetical protein [Actinomadura rupiterrae]